MYNGKRILIFSGGRLGSWALEYIRPDDFLIGADRGALFLAANGRRPDRALGDFDSVTAEELELVKRMSGATEDCDPVDKDFTDTELAVRLALAMSPPEIILLGALGTRFDHSLANVHLLRSAAGCGCKMTIVDAHNRIGLVTQSMKLERSDYTYISLLPLSSIVTGITLEGFRYPLHNAKLEIGQSLGISNVLDHDAGQVSIGSGELLVIESRD